MRDDRDGLADVLYEHIECSAAGRPVVEETVVEVEPRGPRRFVSAPKPPEREPPFSRAE